MIDVNGLRGDLVVSACLRYDLAPIPLTFEAGIRTTQATATDFQQDKIITVNEVEFQIVKTEPLPNAIGVQGSEPISATRIIAFPRGCVGVARPRSSAVVFGSATLGGIYRACGATMPVTGDFPVGRFACLVGDVPTFHIGRLLQEEAAVITWRKQQLAAMRVQDIFKQTPSTNIDIEVSEDLRSEFLEADQIPVYVSTGPDGKFVFGAARGPSRTVHYTPSKTVRELNYMSAILVRRKVIKAAPNLTVRAGDVLSIRGTPYAVITAAHYEQNDTDGSGAQQYSRFWLGVLA
ncbi:hypothetical protein [Paraburkholderia sp. J10-1]|uniref:hypothetical protein n=1 Tax=Paraburkholderia sp. J10-1 TaxID=2805430 RepID=UPI002AB76555|nr:hypothetical protein [Paraburkholderia sp. J10-1]